MGDGTLAKLDYGLTYGYQVVFLGILFLTLFVYNKSLIDLAFSIISLILVILCGSRGPLVCIAVAALMLYLSKWREKKASRFRFFSILFLLIIGLAAFVYTVPTLVNAAMTWLGQSGLQGRAIEKLLDGTITDDSGRSVISEISFDMIRNGGLFGYGFYGDRYVIGRTWYYGYPHNVFLELLIEFGALGGGIISIMLVYHTVRMMIRCKDTTWQFLLITLFGACAKLWMSDSFWYYWPFWGLIAILGLWNMEEKKNGGRKRLLAVK
jgi:O-antigen ligase